MLFGSPLQISSNLLFIMGRHMYISTAFFVSPCHILFCIICGMCKLAKQINSNKLKLKLKSENFRSARAQNLYS